MRPVTPVSVAEFFHLLQRTIPPTGWTPRIALANSGGPDSVALLFLLTALAKEYRESVSSTVLQTVLRFRNEGKVDLPGEVVSIHVNHGLQPAARDMEDVAGRTATMLRARSVVQRIPWGTGPFPSLPAEGTIDEKTAREARYNRIFAAMRATKTNVIATAHHADDQVETVIMRMMRGSSNKGLAGISPIRRWGMGEREKGIFNFGAEGMNAWIVRPLLEIPKDRLLATCEVNKLEYVNDPTNFQPDLTPRNSIRRKLATGILTPIYMSPSRPNVDIAPAVSSMRAMVPHVRPEEQLREAVRVFASRQAEIESQVTHILRRARGPSPASTLLLHCPALAEATTEEVRTALIRRCLRYLSHAPWGSLAAEGSGERASYQRIIRRLWRTDPAVSRHSFAMGAGVQAHPVAVRLELGGVRERPVNPNQNEAEGWVFAREVPYYHATAGQRPGTFVSPERDVTTALLDALRAGKEKYEIMYDHRWRIAFDLRQMPGSVRDQTSLGWRILVDMEGKWALPKVSLSRGKEERGLLRFVWHHTWWNRRHMIETECADWITIKFIRSLDAL